MATIAVGAVTSARIVRRPPHGQTGARGARHKGVRWDPTEIIAKIESLRTDLKSYLTDVAREVREAEATLRAKVDAIVAYDERFSGVATFLVGLFRLAGETALAERVRPSSRRPGQTEADASGGEGSDKPKDG